MQSDDDYNQIQVIVLWDQYGRPTAWFMPLFIKELAIEWVESLAGRTDVYNNLTMPDFMDYLDNELPPYKVPVEHMATKLSSLIMDQAEYNRLYPRIPLQLLICRKVIQQQLALCLN